MRKRRLLLLLLCLPFFMATTSAGEPPAIKAGPDGTKVSLWIPGFLIKLGAKFIPEETDAGFDVGDLLGKLGTTRILVLEGDQYKVSDNRLNRAVRSLEGDGFEWLVTVESAEEQVYVGIRTDRKDRIRKLGVVVDDGETFVKVRMKTKISQQELGALLEDGPLKVVEGMPLSFAGN